MTAIRNLFKGLRTFTTDVTQGFMDVIHNGFALFGLAVMFVCITLAARPDLREASERQLIGWLQTRQMALRGVEVQAERWTAPPQPIPRTCPNSKPRWLIG